MSPSANANCRHFTESVNESDGEVSQADSEEWEVASETSDLISFD